MRCSLWQHVPCWLLGGLLYGLLEIAYRGHTHWTMVVLAAALCIPLEIAYRGHTHWTMVVLAAALCIPLDIANECMPWRLPLWVQGLLGGLTITAGELAAGIVLNIWLGLDIWDYSGLWGNLWGQICPQFTALWCLLAVPAIIIFDWWSYLWGCGERPRYKLI